jgi:catechol 2,3-dioxygenase-like lactoylglutathione lyase family enzyme
MTKYLHTMIRVSSLEDSIAFFEVLGLREIRRREDEKGRYTNVFLAAPGDEAAALNSPTTGIRNLTLAAAISGTSPMPWTTSTTPAAPSSPAA